MTYEIDIVKPVGRESEDDLIILTLRWFVYAETGERETSFSLVFRFGISIEQHVQLCLTEQALWQAWVSGSRWHRLRDDRCDRYLHRHTRKDWQPSIQRQRVGSRYQSRKAEIMKKAIFWSGWKMFNFWKRNSRLTLVEAALRERDWRQSYRKQQNRSSRACHTATNLFPAI